MNVSFFFSRPRAGPLLLFLLAGLASSSRGRAQQPPPVAPPGAASAPEDSATISARGALLRSLVLPGWGQSYVGAPGRGAIYFAFEAGSLWMTYKSVRGLQEARELESWLRDTGALEEDEDFGLAESRREQREDWIALSLFWILASGADAYVSAQLADFDEHVGVRPGPGGELRFEARFPLGARR